MRCERDAPDGSPRAEFAVAVADADQGQGVGTLLLEHLARIALRNGITAFEADVLGDNRRMFELLAASGFKVSESTPGQVVRVSFPTAENDVWIGASDERLWKAAAESLRAMLSPRSVAVVGASRRPGSIGAALGRRRGTSNRRARGSRSRIVSSWNGWTRRRGATGSFR